MIAEYIRKFRLVIGIITLLCLILFAENIGIVVKRAASNLSTYSSQTATASLRAQATPTVSPDLRVVSDGFADNTYLVRGRGVNEFSIGDDLIVYSEITPGTEVATALLRVTAKNPNSVTAQTILVHPSRRIRPELRVDGSITQLSTSELVPTVEVAVGYVLKEGRVRLLVADDLEESAQLKALAPEIIDVAIVDYLPFADQTQMQITDIGVTGIVASAELVVGEWPPPGTILIKTSPSDAYTPEQANTSSGALTNFLLDRESNWEWHDVAAGNPGGTNVNDGTGWITIVDHNGEGVLVFLQAFGSGYNEANKLRVSLDERVWKEYTGFAADIGAGGWNLADDNADRNVGVISIMPFKKFDSSLKVEIYNEPSNGESSARVNFLTPLSSE